MAHLQPTTHAQRPGPARQTRLTALRGFTPDTVQLSGAEVRELWQALFHERGPGHRFWLYTHVPFCPQICTFCQCSTSLRKSDRQVATYLDWLDGEIDYLADTAAGAEVAYQYIGGGTPNLLTEPQLDRLLGTLERRFRFAPGARRTFEFLPSSLRPETLPLVRAHGFNRLSCGVQSWNSDTLRAVNRSRVGLDDFGATVRAAFDLGFDEINLDLIHGIGAEERERFLDSLLHVLEWQPTTVTIHHVIPTATNPVFASVAEELAAHAVFEQLRETIGTAVAKRFPHVEWVLRPNSWILVDRRFHQGGDFSLWYYSDNERIHIDMLSFGRFAHSNILGRVLYENLSRAERYDPAEASYRAFRKTPAIDAALDLITDLVGDKRSELAPIAARYGTEGLAPLEPVLEQLAREGRVARAGSGWAAVDSDGVFIDPFAPLLDAALDQFPRRAAVPVNKDTEHGIVLGAGERTLTVFVEKRDAKRRYYVELGALGVYYRHPDGQAAADREDWVEGMMQSFVAEVRALLERTPHIAAKRAIAELRRRLAAAD